jgi:hypothetical protein
MDGINKVNDILGKQFDEMLDKVPKIVSDSELREVIQGALLLWSKHWPGQVKEFVKYAKHRREAFSSRKALTEEGAIPGEVPSVVDQIVGDVLNDPAWITRKKGAAGIFFDEFPEGRYSYYEGKGEGSSKLTLSEKSFK